jgi:hypothetical protein
MEHEDSARLCLDPIRVAAIANVRLGGLVDAEGVLLREELHDTARTLPQLERLAQEFEPGVRFTGKELNGRLEVFHPDYAALRRYLVDEGIRSRADGVYGRTGGRFPLEFEGPVKGA